MAERKKFSPQRWTPEQAARALSAIESPPADLSPESLEDLKAAYTWYEQNMPGEPDDTQQQESPPRSPVSPSPSSAAANGVKKFRPETWDEEKAARAEAWATMTPEAFAAETGKSLADHAALRDAVIRYHNMARGPTREDVVAAAPLMAAGSLASPEMEEAAQYTAGPETPDVPMWQSFLHGAKRGATMDFADEGAGGLMGTST